MEQLKSIGRELAMGSQGGFGQSKEFLELVKSIGEARSKAEEDRIVLREIETLKRRLTEPEIPTRRMKEYLMRLVYVEMLGHDASFGYIHAVKMTHHNSLVLKRTGYLAVTLFLSDSHDLIILIVNTIQKDLRSDNYLVVCAALNAVCKLISEDTIPAVLPPVVELLSHPKDAVRKKALMALHRFHLRSPSSVSHLLQHFRQRLCDSDPGVMGAALCPLADLAAADPAPLRELVPSLVGILKQVAERRLPKSYDYHSLPAPFIQIKLLKLLALLAASHRASSETTYAVLSEMLSRGSSDSNMANAVLYECICCVSALHPRPDLLDSAAAVIARFLKSDSHNLKYMGIDCLARLISTNPDIAQHHQLAVIDCLEDPDDTLKRKTFDLLYKMTNSSNVQVIAHRMIDYIITINDHHYKTYIASRCVHLAEQFAPTNNWFIQTMNKVFEHAGDLVNAKVAHNLMRLIAEGFGDDDETADSQLRSSAVQSYLHILGEPKLPSLFLQVICWVLGEYGTADGKYSASYITGKLCDVAEAYSNDETVRAYAITAIMKIYAFEISAGRKVDLLPECQSLIEELAASHSTDLQQRPYELQAVVGLDAHALAASMPLDASCEDVEIDKDLSFLNHYVDQSIEKGAQPYIPESERSGALSISTFGIREQHEMPAHGLKFEAYELPKPPVPTRVTPLSSSTELVPVPEPSYPTESHQATSVPPSVSDSGSSELKLRLDGVQKKWGRPAYSSSPAPSTSTSQKATNGVSQDVTSTVSSKGRETYDSRKSQVEINPEKQKLAASLFGGSSKPERKSSSSANHKVAKTSRSHSQATKSATEVAADRTSQQAPPPPPGDLLDLSEGSAASAAPTVDPFKQLEGLLDSSSTVNHGSDGALKTPDLMALYGDSTGSGESGGGGLDFGVTPNLVGVANADQGGAAGTQFSKGPIAKNSLEKDALARQMGVNPSSQNPNLFRDLLG